MLGHLSAERQAHMLSYTKPSLKSFLNFISTHEDYLLRNKKLKWVLFIYTKQFILVPTYATKKIIREPNKK